MKKLFTSVFLVLIATYITLTFTLPVDPGAMARYDISDFKVRLLNLSILLPVTLIYLAALYGCLRVGGYAVKVRGTKEGAHFDNLAKGLMVLAFSLPLSSVMGNLTTYVKSYHPHMLSDVTIFRQYLRTGITLLAMYLIAKGAQGLYGMLKKQDGLRVDSYYGIVGPVALASLYTWLVVTRGEGGADGGPYYLPGWLLILTVVIPQLLTWCIGAWAALYLYRYQRAVKGVIYKRALASISQGIGVIVVIAILLQFLLTMSGGLSRLDLGPLLGMIYVLLALYVVGFGLVARGARKLKQIEEA